MASAVRPHNTAALEEVVSNVSAADNSKTSANKTSNAFFRAGDRVPAPGSYWVWHKDHRPSHAAKVRFTVFPSCAQCGDHVRYRPIDEKGSTATEWLRRDPDFRHALIRKGKGKTSAQP